MKIKMWQVFKILNIYSRVKELKAPAKVAYKFNKLCVSLENENNFYGEELNKIIQQYGEREEDGSFKKTVDGTGIKIKQEVLETAQKEINNLDFLDVEAPDISFTIEELDGLQLSIEDFQYMLPFIKEE